jgi:coenzyme PQQ precursor peptide PqqA
MAWNTPKITEVSCGMEVTTYASATWNTPTIAEVSCGMEVTTYASAKKN